MFTRHALARIATLTLAVVILYLTLTPQPMEARVPGTDKLHHFLAFAALVMPSALLHRRALFWTVPLAVVIGGAIEIIQPYVGRDRDIHDFMADCIGVALGCGLGLVLRFARERLRGGRARAGSAS